MLGELFEVLVIQPIFNLLVFIYALFPGHNFGIAIILFTVVIRLLMWPLVKKQLHHTKEMRKLQPELKRIKQAAKGDRQKESAMMMELYKERQINPFSSIGVLVVQFIVLIGLYLGLRRVVDDPRALIDHSYGWLNNLGWLRALAEDIGRFDGTLLGVADLTRSAIAPGTGTYWPAMALVIGSASIQYFLSSQLMPKDKDARSLRRILREASEGKQAESAELNAAIGSGMRYLIPGMIFIFTVGLPSALSLYWFTGGVVAYFQQARALKQDEEEMEEIADKATPKDIIEGEVIDPKEIREKKQQKAKKASKSKTKKRRRRR